MRLAIEVVWWIGLVGALVPTLVIVKEAFLVVGTLRRILLLAKSTEAAALGIAEHMAPAAKLQGVAEIVQRLDADVRDAARGLRKLSGRSGRGSDHD